MTTYSAWQFNERVSAFVRYAAYGACDALAAAMPELGLTSRDFEQALYAYAKRHNVAFETAELFGAAREIIQELVNQRRNQLARDNVDKLNARRTV